MSISPICLAQEIRIAGQIVCTNPCICPPAFIVVEVVQKIATQVAVEGIGKDIQVLKIIVGENNKYETNPYLNITHSRESGGGAGTDGKEQ